MKSSMRMGQKLLFLFLSIFLMSWFVSCAPEAKQKDDVQFIAAVDGVPEEYLGTWVNDAFGYKSVYILEKSKITDKSMNCAFNVVSDTPVQILDDYILILTQCVQGTDYTPAGFYYAIALKKIGDTLNISCPLDYSLKISSLSELKERFNSSYDPEFNVSNYYTVCTPENETIDIENSDMGLRVSFSKKEVAMYGLSIDGYEIYDDTPFTPKRDKSKEDDNTLLYLYSEIDRSLVADLMYVAVKVTGDGEKVVYYYVYDEEEGDEDTYNYYEEYWDEDFMMFPTVSDTQLAELKEMFP